MKKLTGFAITSLVVIQAGAQTRCGDEQPPSGIGQMGQHYVRDGQFHVIGRIEMSHGGNQRAYDADAHFIGAYDCRSNRTYDPHGQTAGIGDLLVGLIWQAARR